MNKRVWTIAQQASWKLTSIVRSDGTAIALLLSSLPKLPPRSSITNDPRFASFDKVVNRSTTRVNLVFTRRLIAETAGPVDSGSLKSACLAADTADSCSFPLSVEHRAVDTVSSVLSPSLAPDASASAQDLERRTI